MFVTEASDADRNRSGDGDTDQGDLGILLADWGYDDPVNGCAGEVPGGGNEYHPRCVRLHAGDGRGQPRLFLNLMRAGSFLGSQVTGADRTVTFLYGPTKVEGTYTSTVTGVTKDGWTYNPDDNVETSESLVVP